MVLLLELARLASRDGSEDCELAEDIPLGLVLTPGLDLLLSPPASATLLPAAEEGEESVWSANNCK